MGANGGGGAPNGGGGGDGGNGGRGGSGAGGAAGFGYAGAPGRHAQHAPHVAPVAHVVGVHGEVPYPSGAAHVGNEMGNDALNVQLCNHGQAACTAGAMVAVQPPNETIAVATFTYSVDGHIMVTFCC